MHIGCVNRLNGALTEIGVQCSATRWIQSLAIGLVSEVDELIHLLRRSAVLPGGEHRKPFDGVVAERVALAE